MLKNELFFRGLRQAMSLSTRNWEGVLLKRIYDIGNRGNDEEQAAKQSRVEISSWSPMGELRTLTRQ